LETIKIDEKTCTRCGICADECPGYLISFQPGGYPQPVSSIRSACLRCGHCVAVCPTGSLNHNEMPVEQCARIQESLKTTPEQVEQLLKSRRSVRVFKDQPVPREIVRRLIEDARYAPTGHNDQEVEWLVIDNREELNRIEALGSEWIQWIIKNQPRMAAMFNMKDMLKRQELNHNVFLRGCPVLIVTHAIKDRPMALIDSSTALGYLDLAANGLGMGTCWAGFVYIMANNFPPVREAIALPEGHATLGAMMLGYNKFKYQRVPSRKEPPIIWR
jgi:nitroreductase/NAD-dependent dihydropyrimidine dehydrogenase PreA subunit